MALTFNKFVFNSISLIRSKDFEIKGRFFDIWAEGISSGSVPVGISVEVSGATDVLVVVLAKIRRPVTRAVVPGAESP